MATTSSNDQFVGRLFARLNQNPTAADLDFLVESYNTVGYLAAEAEGLAEQAEAERKYWEASYYLTVRKDAIERGEKVTERQVEAERELLLKGWRVAEAEARTKSRKLKNLYGAVEQAINAIKHLSKQEGYVTGTVRLPGQRNG